MRAEGVPAIQFDRVSKTFPGAVLPAVDDCSLAVSKGQFVVLLGPSGCGKTTLLKMVNRLAEPTSGVVCIEGADTREMDATQLRRRIGYVFQQGGLFPHMTVARNVAVVPELLGWSESRIRQRVDELLELVHLPPADYRHRYPGQLSGGQQQRVGVARALAGDPDIVLMDEPFGALDAITRLSLQDELARLQRQLHKTILFVTHDVEEALRLADRIAVLRAGRIVQVDTPLAILSRPADDFVHQLMGAESLVRLLGLVRAGAAMSPLPPGFRAGEDPSIDSDQNLRDALDLLLRTRATRLLVTDGNGPQGQITFADLGRVAAQDSPP